MCILWLYPLQWFEAHFSISHTDEDYRTYLNRLSMCLVNVYANDDVFELGVCTLHRIVINIDNITESLHTIPYELPECLQVLGTR